jgi:hypothetical protein
LHFRLEKASNGADMMARNNTFEHLLDSTDAARFLKINDENTAVDGSLRVSIHAIRLGK